MNDDCGIESRGINVNKDRPSPSRPIGQKKLEQDQHGAHKVANSVDRMKNVRQQSDSDKRFAASFALHF